MADDAVFSPADEGLSPNSGIEITVGERSGNSEELLDDDGEEDFDINTSDLGEEDDQMLEVKSNDLENDIQQVLEIERVDLENGEEQVVEYETNDHESNGERVLEIPSSSGQMDGISISDNEMNIAVGLGNRGDAQSYPLPAVGMEFESYDDAYNYYNCYAKELGFGIRVKSSWTKRNSKEKRGAVLCCNCEGFKTMKETSTRRKETRTGCLAMIRLRLVEMNRWRLDEVKLEHNHLFDHQRAQTSRSHKKMETGAKRKLEPVVDVEVQTIKLYRTQAVDSVSYGSSMDQEVSYHLEPFKCLKFGTSSDLLVLHDYFRQAQLSDPNFFYIMDLNDGGYVRNVFWIDSRSRAAYGYFGDVVVIDSTCLSNKHNIPLCSFSGLNHHGKTVLFGCGFLVDETIETYVWLMRAWLTCMSGRPPQTIITQQCQALRSAVSEVFPRAHHRLCLSLVMQSIREKLGEVGGSELFQTFLNRAVYTLLKVEEFELAWEETIRHFAIRDDEWLRALYEDRERWVPAYLKDSIFNGIFSFQPGEYTTPFFHGVLHNQMTWSEFFSAYELLRQRAIQKESLDDFESRQFRPTMKTRCSYELQASDFYTKDIFLKFQDEVVLMSSCCGVTQVQANGSLITYVVKERSTEGNTREAKNYEVVYDKVGPEVRCICCCFNFKGYLCRHALTVLQYNDAEEIPSQYLLQRWSKDAKRVYVPDFGSNAIDTSNPVQWYEHLHRLAMRVVTEGTVSSEHQMAAWQAFKESLNKLPEARFVCASLRFAWGLLRRAATTLMCFVHDLQNLHVQMQMDN
ncbi:protein FAR1-RELATED SEQUENCE 8-like isoform X2 [Andrographis paniculata]|uniref:protein FAR1-RELATED SEQUENCE 8-like isoform X2 n=1 Tax=Andrographis paniculata TaxID=175694 RepID=UPI0021E6EBE0|nr:protein FAR1-RELATED SEQUENCE 8-like isoform X2 [Andrographis paniculata]